MGFKKFRWSKVYESSEEELIALLQARNIHSQRLYAEASSTQTEQHTDSTITIWCAEGSLVVEAGSTSVSLQPGDALHIEANISYLAHPGIANCVYYLTS
jgi:quercetin dioxygenase-like cupin family protein